jgi:hypothetical protein
MSLAGHPMPLVIGLVYVPAGMTASDAHRLHARLTLEAFREGYGVLDVLEVGSRQYGSDRTVYAALDALDALDGRSEAVGVMVLGSVDRERVGKIAARMHIRVLEVSGT